MDELELEHRLTTVEKLAGSNRHRLDAVEERQANLDKLVASVEVLATRQETVENDVREIKTDVKVLRDKPGKRWDSIVDKLIWAVLAAALGFVLAQVGVA
ncbi:MAG: hypothetical protein MR648_07215 [Clostridiales bacterium]|nr:hypothetical protein [Clostridiales bacterium]MDY4180376.1 hypothetical protein [Pseudoflavonifractor sp.]